MPKQGTPNEREIRALTDQQLAARVDRLAHNLRAFPASQSKVILAEAARRIRWNRAR